MDQGEWQWPGPPFVFNLFLYSTNSFHKYVMLHCAPSRAALGQTLSRAAPRIAIGKPVDLWGK